MPVGAPLIVSDTRHSWSGNALQRMGAALEWGAQNLDRSRVSGVVVEITVSHYRVSGLSRFLRLGECVYVEIGQGVQMAEVVKIDEDAVVLKPFDAKCDAAVGARAYRASGLSLFPCDAWKGRVVNALASPIDDAGDLAQGSRAMPLDAKPPEAMRRGRVNKPIRTGVRVIDLFTPLCAGQRVGIFAGSGVGKSSLLGMLARAPQFDTVVVALVGERGREVSEFLAESLGDNRKSAIVVVATGDESPMMRRLAPKTATTIAEYFRDRGDAVLLIVDSITRFAHAARDVALAAGEPAVARGYAPSVFSDLPRLLERAGPGLENSGSITGLFSVLIDGDDHNDPVADSVRGTLDGHIVLDRNIAEQGRYPAVNVLSSISRLSHWCWTPEQGKLVSKLRALVARYEDTREIRLLGGYTPGADPLLDHAVKSVPRIYDAMAQSTKSGPCLDPFAELANALRSDGKSDEDGGRGGD